MSLAALQDGNRILKTIQSDATMKQRWNRYCAENYYARGIAFDDVLEVLTKIVN